MRHNLICIALVSVAWSVVLRLTTAGYRPVDLAEQLSGGFIRAAIDQKGEFAYYRTVGTRRSRYCAAKIALGLGEAIPKFVGVVKLNSPEFRAAEAYTCASGYVGEPLATSFDDGTRFLYSYKSSRVQKRLTGSQQVLGEVTIPRSSGYLRAAGCVLKDESARVIYVGTARGPSDPAQVVKIAAGERLEPPTLIGSLTLEEANITCGVIDPARGYAYVGTGPASVKVALGEAAQSPRRVGACLLPRGAAGPETALLDRANRYAYFANRDTITKIALGDEESPPRQIASIRPVPHPGDLGTWMLMPAALPLILAWIAPWPRRDRWSPAFLNYILVAAMLLSMGEIFVFGTRASFGGVALMLPALTVPFFFLLPLGQSFLDGVAAGRESLRPGSAGGPWRHFWQLVGPQRTLWLVLWAIYVTGFELFMGWGFGWGHMLTTAVCLGLASGMVAACFLAAPRCRRLGTLATLAAVGSLGFLVVASFLGGWLVIQTIGEGYMGLNAIFGLLVAPAVLVPLAVACWAFAQGRGDAWFR